MSNNGQHSGDRDIHLTAGSQHATSESSQRPEPSVGQEPALVKGTVRPDAHYGDAEVFKIPPVDALRIISSHLSNLARLTGDVPVTPMGAPSGEPPGSTNLQAGNEIPPPRITELHWAGAKNIADGATLVGVDQQKVLAKRFYSKRAPPISLQEYLLRLHKYCPMSTAVYLATSLYITRMAISEQILSVTPRNVHRLALAGLRVATKALEDLNYPHGRFAKVGGVSERELTRLEITFCFLTDFDLRVDVHMLMCQATLLQRGTAEPQADLTLGIQQSQDDCNDRALIASASRPKEIVAGVPET